MKQTSASLDFRSAVSLTERPHGNWQIFFFLSPFTLSPSLLFYSVLTQLLLNVVWFTDFWWLISIYRLVLIGDCVPGDWWQRLRECRAVWAPPVRTVPTRYPGSSGYCYRHHWGAQRWWVSLSCLLTTLDLIAFDMPLLQKAASDVSLPSLVDLCWATSVVITERPDGGECILDPPAFKIITAWRPGDGSRICFLQFASLAAHPYLYHRGSLRCWA